MSLVEKAKQGAPRSRKGPACGTCQILATLPGGERDALGEMLDSASGWSAKAIREALLDEGIDAPGFKSIERHRRGDCEPLGWNCDKSEVVPTPPRIGRVA